jgi:anaerobic selenocysteine-containing dehydrogenase
MKGGKIRVSETVKTICRMCLMGCGVIAHVKEGAVIKVEGNPDFPVNKGGICPKGLSSIQLLYDPKRLNYPLRRVGKRGEGKWERISWDDALGITATRLNEIKRRDGARAVAFAKGQAPAWDIWYDLWTRLVMTFGSPNLATPSNVCYFPRRSSYVTFGEYADSDFDNNNGIIVLWGYNPAYSSLPASCRRIFEARDRGAQLMVIDPVFTPMAAKADLYIRLRPGTDLALALGMVNVIIMEGLYDKDFVEQWTVGFDRLAEHIKDYPPEKVEKITGVPCNVVREAARRYATIKPGLIAIGNGVEQTTNSVQTIRGLSILQALAGSLDIPGGNVSDPEPWPMGRLNPTMMLDCVPNYVKETLSTRPLYAEFDMSNRGEVVEAILSGQPYPIKGMLVFGTNLVTTTAQSTKVTEALQKIEFLAVHDLYLTPTAEYADIVFPCTSFLESDDYCYWRLGSARHGRPQTMHIHMWQPAVVEAIGECRSNWSFVVGVARALGLEEYFPWNSLEEYVEWELKATGKDFTVEQLKQSPDGLVTVYPPDKLYKKYESIGFKTPSGKVELYSSILEEFGYDPLPVYREPAESPVSTPELAQRYPLICNNGLKPGGHTHSQFHELPWIMGIHPEPFAAVHPSTASRYSVKDGEQVIIESPRAHVKLRARVTKAVPPNTVFIPHGWKEPRYNDLTDDKNVDPIAGSFSTRAFLCELRKA